MADFIPQQIPPATPQALAGSLFQAPAPPQAPPVPAPPQTPYSGITPTGGVTPAVPQVAAPQPAAAPTGLSPQQMQQYGVAPVQQPPAPVVPAPKRTEIERLVRQGQMTAEEAAYYPSDDVLFDDLIGVISQQQAKAAAPAPAPASAPVQPAPAAVPNTQTPQEIAQTAITLQQQGILVFQDGRYVSKYPEFTAVADRLNTDRLRAEQSLQELSDPQAWLRKHGTAVIEDATKPLRELSLIHI